MEYYEKLQIFLYIYQINLIYTLQNYIFLVHMSLNKLYCPFILAIGSVQLI